MTSHQASLNATAQRKMFLREIARLHALLIATRKPTFPAWTAALIGAFLGISLVVLAAAISTARAERAANLQPTPAKITVDRNTRPPQYPPRMEKPRK